MSQWQWSFKRPIWLLQRHFKPNPCKAKLSTSGEDEAFLLKGGCKPESPSCIKQDFRYKCILTYRVRDHVTYSETLRATQHSWGHRSGASMRLNRAVLGTHLCARPRHIAAISREGRPVISPSICERIPLISSVTIGLCIQLKFSLSCRMETNGPKGVSHNNDIPLKPFFQ